MLLCAYLYITKSIKIFTFGWRFNLLASCLSLIPSTLKNKQQICLPMAKNQTNKSPLHLGLKKLYYKWLDVGLLAYHSST